jgi:single-stranded DNA-binding protein
MSPAERWAPLPARTPPEINHAVLTGRLGADPQEGRSPVGDRVTLLRVEFPVADPDRPQTLWRCATCLVEVSESRSRLDIEELRGGSPVLATGQLSDRWTIEGGHTSRCGVIVADQVKAGPPEIPERLLL